jgi:hypothetical protein
MKVSVFKSLCCTYACLSTRALCCICARLSTRVLCCTWTCLPTKVQCMLYRRGTVYKHFFVCRFFSKQVCLFVSVVPTRVRNTETNRNINFLISRNKNEKQPKQIVFRFFSVQTENIFCLFRGHPSWNKVRVLTNLLAKVHL